MPRKPRVILPNIAHHAIQRGNYQRYVFEKDADFRIYLNLVNKYSQDYAVKVHAFCLMGNHVHFIITPADQKGLSELFKNVHMRYSQYKNSERRRSGHLWQGRFFSCVLTVSHLLRAIRYVEMNPVRAGMVNYPWDYRWSSARQHLGVEVHPIIKTVFPEDCQEAGLNDKNWKAYLLEEDLEMTSEIRLRTQKGLAVGSKESIARLEQRFGMILRESKAGRPRMINK